jgi:hypothetical protein
MGLIINVLLAVLTIIGGTGGGPAARSLSLHFF